MNKFNFIKMDGYKYAKADFTRNMILLKREVFNKIKWDERLKFSGEHLDFLLQIKNSEWDLVFTPDSIHKHREDIIENHVNTNYKKTRKLNDRKNEIFREKWGIENYKIKRPFFHKLKAGIIKLLKLMVV
jgi:hypothetical protein